MTGEYLCKVETFQGDDDARAQYLQMIVPETHFYLNVRKPFEGAGNNLSVECTAKNIYPEPQLKILYVFPAYHRYPYIIFLSVKTANG